MNVYDNNIDSEVINMFCPKCGKEIPDGSKFCSYCGEKIEQVEEVKSEEDIPLGISTKNRKTAFIFTFLIALYGIIFLIISLLFGMGWHLFIFAGAFVFLFTIGMTTYKKVELTQKELDKYNEIYGVRNGKQTGNAIASLDQVKGLTRQNVYLIAAGKKGLGILGFLAYLLATAGFIFGIVGPLAGFAGFGLNINGVYVQSQQHASSGGVGQEGLTAYKVDGDRIYYTGYYDGTNTNWGGGYSYHRVGNKVTYTFTGGGMNSTHDLYFVNFGNNIASDRFGFSIAFTRK